MSRGSEKSRDNLLEELARELRQFNGLGASFFRAAAARIGMTVTDMQVIDLLDSNGPMTAGQIADLTGLTTGAITGMLNRLEEVGRVRRERDPNDGRRVIVQLEKGKDEKQEIGPVFDSIEGAWDEMAARYNDEQLAFLLEFLKNNNTVTRQEIARLREAPSNEEGIYTAPLGDLESARLVISSGVILLNLRSDTSKDDKLYKARFEGPVPEVKVKDGEVNIRYPRRLWVMGGAKRGADISLSLAIPWRIEVQGGASQIKAILNNLNLAGLEVKGGASMINLELPVPLRIVPIRISGGASEIRIQRPADVPARVRLKGWASELHFDDQYFSNLGNDVRMQSPHYNLDTPGYDIEVLSSTSTVIISNG